MGRTSQGRNSLVQYREEHRARAIGSSGKHSQDPSGGRRGEPRPVIVWGPLMGGAVSRIIRGTE